MGSLPWAGSGVMRRYWKQIISLEPLGIIIFILFPFRSLISKVNSQFGRKNKCARMDWLKPKYLSERTSWRVISGGHCIIFSAHLLMMTLVFLFKYTCSSSWLYIYIYIYIYIYTYICIYILYIYIVNVNNYFPNSKLYALKLLA